jgi:hypothetical protein
MSDTGICASKGKYARVAYPYPDPDHFGKLDPDPHQRGKLDLDPHQSENKDSHQREKVEAF